MDVIKYEVYTDGADRHKDHFHIGAWCAYIKSLQDTRICSGIVRMNNSQKFVVTNNRMELLAIINAMRMCKEGSDIVVHSDSEYSVGVLSKKEHAKVNKDLINDFDKIVEDRKLHIDLQYIEREKNTFVDGIMRHMLNHNDEAKKHDVVEE